ncbi:MAG: hypothetical protein K0Q72_273 [Armatimonadetes bacterium]|nr:hypothetical protein [Armatimonadota bacterium]
MKIEAIDPPREFRAGRHQQVALKDCAHIALAADEQVTFVTESGGEFDVLRKSWGFYATPSLNGRLLRFGLRPVLARNGREQTFVLLVEQGHEADFEQYLADDGMTIVCWLDEGGPRAGWDGASKGDEGE